MRVRVERHVYTTGERAGEPIPPGETRHGDAIDTEHVVLALEARVVQPRGMSALHFLIKSSPTATPAWSPAGMYAIVDPSLPSIWVARLDSDIDLVLAPTDWHQAGFWDAFHNGVGERGARAREIFERDRDVIIAADEASRR
jgi:hypothetical protein